MIPLPLAHTVIPWHRRLEARVLLSAALVAGLALLAVVMATRTVVTRWSLEHAQSDLITAGEAFNRLVKTRADSAAKETRLVVELPNFRALLSDKGRSADRPTMNAITADYCGKLGADVCIVTDRRGVWIGRSGTWSANDRTVDVTATIEPARSGRSARSIVSVGGTLYLLVAEPALFSQEVLGTLTAAYALDDDVVAMLAEEAHCAVTVLCDGSRICASSMPVAARTALLESLTHDPNVFGGAGAAPKRHDVDGVPYVGSVWPLQGRARLVLLQDWRPTENALGRIHAAVLLVGVISFGIAIFGAWIFSLRITRPLRELAAVASDVARGQWHRRVQPDGAAEARVTAEAFNHMTLALSHWRDEAESRAEEVRTSYERFRAVTDSASDAIVSTDRQGRIVFWSRRAHEIFGYDEHEAAGRMFTSLVPERHRRLCAEQIARQSASDPDAHKSDRTFELSGIRRDGSEVPLEMALSTWKAGTEVFHTGIIRDITERKQAAHALKKSEEQLRQAQKMEAIGRLAGGIAHDFNNLLTAILGYTHLLQTDLPPDHPLRADIDEIERAGQSAASLTRELLAFSRKQVLQPVVLDLNSVVENTEKLLRRIVGEDVELVLSLTSDSTCVRADRSQMEQVIMNLAVNARDAMPSGGRLTIATESVGVDGTPLRHGLPPVGGRHVLLTVSDTGHGMTEDVLHHIFEPFFTTKAVGKGTGLGLATVYGTVQQSGGYIWVESTVGEGSTFHICLPALQDAAEVATEETYEPPPARGSETVLLVEDNDAVRRLARETLQRAGYEVLVATNGVEALDVAGEKLLEIAVVVTDMVMPAMGGLELATRLRELRRDLRIIFTSGYSDDPELSRQRPDLAAAFLQKPFSPSQLARVVRETIDATPTAVS